MKKVLNKIKIFHNIFIFYNFLNTYWFLCTNYCEKNANWSFFWQKKKC